MNREEVQKLRHGLYRVYWASGGTSLAAVGSTPKGQRWLAPTNWVNVDQPQSLETWKKVRSMELLFFSEPSPRSENKVEAIRAGGRITKANLVEMGTDPELTGYVVACIWEDGSYSVGWSDMDERDLAYAAGYLFNKTSRKIFQ